jgi:hypothetical protein
VDQGQDQALDLTYDDEASLAIVPAQALELQDRSVENPDGTNEIDAVFAEIRFALPVIPLELPGHIYTLYIQERNPGTRVPLMTCRGRHLVDGNSHRTVRCFDAAPGASSKSRAEISRRRPSP